MRILAICPSIYPDKLKSMIHSFQETKSSAFTELIVNTDIKPITQVFNEEFENRPDYDFYMMLNDDIVFKTLAWDADLANKGKISYAMDRIQNENLCTFPMIDGDIVRALGWLQLPSLENYCGDMVWNIIGKECKILNYNREVVIHHEWIEEQVNKEIHKKDQAKFAEWLMSSHRDIRKVKEILCV